MTATQRVRSFESDLILYSFPLAQHGSEDIFSMSFNLGGRLR